MAHRVLVVEDEPDILELVRLSLSQAGWDVETAACAEDAMTALRRSPPDLAILDVMLPDRPGTQICRDIRADPTLQGVAVIMLTAKGEEIDRVVGFELGADDYVTKPFSPRELVLRASAVVRRTSGAAGSSAGSEGPAILTHGDLVLDRERHRCSVKREEIELTAKEFELLAALMSRPGRVMRRERLLEEVWGSDVSVTLRTIDTHLKRLREKLGDAGSLIGTIRGIGYRFTE